MIIHDKNVSELWSSLAPWELAPCKLTSYLRTVVVSAGSVGAMGGATVLKVGDNFASGASQKNFWTPLLASGVGQNIA